MQENGQEFMLLMKATDWGAELSAQELQAEMEKFMGWVEGMNRQGILKAGQPLLPQGRVVSAKKGQTVSDGPFVESKEAVGGFFLITVADEAAAVEVAKSCPVLQHGMYIEVRPVAVQCHMIDVYDLDPMPSMAKGF